MSEPTPDNPWPYNPPAGGPPLQYGSPAGYPNYPQTGYPGYPHGGYPEYPHAPYYYQPPRKRPVWPWVLGAVLVVMFLGAGGCLAVVAMVGSRIDSEAQPAVNVTYEVAGSGSSVNITYTDGGYNTAQQTVTTLPWTKDVRVDGLIKTVWLTAANGPDDGTVTCKITAGGKTLAQETATGPYTVVSCIGDASGV